MRAESLVARCVATRIGPLIALFAAIFLNIATGPADAMEFRVGDWKGHYAIFAKGEIQAGDAHRLDEIAESATKADHGHIVLILESPGGNVGAAFETAKIIKNFGMHTIIPAGAKCQSACGAILFVAGALRTIEEGGELGLHTCYSAKTGQSDKACNEIIAAFAVENGISHGSIMAGLSYAGSSEMLPMSREIADCFGITLYPGTEHADLDFRDPCVLEMLAGKKAGGEAIWRLDIDKGGSFSAFTRPASTYENGGELRLSCRESNPGRLYMSVTLNGTPAQLKRAVKQMRVKGTPTIWETTDFDIESISPEQANVSVVFPQSFTKPLLTRTDYFQVTIDLNEPFTKEPIVLTTSIRVGRPNLIFAAMHCRP